MARMGLKAYAKQVAAAGRNGDTELAHLTPDEIEVLISLQDIHGIEPSINPETGLPEFFSLKKILKGVAKAAGAIAGGYFGGPVGSAVGAGAVSKLLGDSTSTALSTGLLAGLGSWGAQQTGLGDWVGGGFSSGANLLGQTAADSAIQTASGAANQVASSGSSMGLSAALPLIGLGGAALAAGSRKPPESDDIDLPDEPEFQEYEPLDRQQLAYAGDPYSYGIFGPEFQYFDEVNPGLQPLAMRDGGRVYFKYGGNVSEGGKKQGASEKGGQGPNAGGGQGGRDRTASVTGNRFGAPSPSAQAAARARNKPSGTGTTDVDRLMDRLGIGTGPTPQAVPGQTPTINRTRSWSNPDWDLKDVAKARASYKNRSGIWGVLDTIAGPFIDVNEPDWNNPASFAGGDWHTSTNLGGAAAALAGLGLGAPGLGFIGSQIDNLVGIPDLYHGSWEMERDIRNETDQARAAGSSGAGQGIGHSGGRQGGTGRGGENLATAITRAAATAAGAAPAPSSTPSSPTPQPAPTPTGRTYIPLNDPYTYGIFGPEHQFFTSELNMSHGGDVDGPGDGQSDSIPAMLSKGEYVIDAESVAALGDGSTDAGAKKLDDFRRTLRQHKRKAPANKIPPKARSITEYMRSAA